MRLKEVLPFIINEGQGAFVHGRELLFNVLLCQDITRGYNRKVLPPSCIVKVDLHKAFDSVHWAFLQEWLKALKFPPLFIKWVMNCITSVKFTINTNGKQGAFFKGKRGLKQGDPISPLLLVMSMEYSLGFLKGQAHRQGFNSTPNVRSWV